jgi:hypothetical protein
MAYEMALIFVRENDNNRKRCCLIASAVWNAHAQPDYITQRRLSLSEFWPALAISHTEIGRLGIRRGCMARLRPRTGVKTDFDERGGS